MDARLRPARSSTSGLSCKLEWGFCAGGRAWCLAARWLVPPPALLVALLARAPCARRGQRRPWNLAANVVRLMLLSL